MDREREMMMKQIMQLDFAVYELNLYLDTHPNDKRILMIFKDFAAQAKEMKFAFNQKYGPIEACDNTADTWEWNKNPWPWEKS